MKAFLIGFLVTILIIASLASCMGCVLLFIYAIAGEPLTLWLKLCPLIAAICGGGWFWLAVKD